MGVVISLSNGGSTWSCNSTTVVAMPRRTKFSTSSRPMNPAPTMTACRTPGQSVLDAVDVLQVPQGEDAGQVDAGNRRTQRCRSGCQDQLVVGFLVLSPEARSRTRTFFAFRSMASTDVRVRTSSLKRVRSRSGVTTSSLSRSAISPPR